MLGGAASGTTAITNLAPGADVASTVACMAALGARIDPQGRTPLRSQASARLVSASRAPRSTPAIPGRRCGCSRGRREPADSRVVVGDESLSRRPMQRIIDPLSAMGARITSANGRSPLVIEGGALQAIDWLVPVASAQVKSAILLAGLGARGTTIVREPLLTRDHTERAFPAFGLRVRRQAQFRPSTAARRPSRLPGRSPFGRSLLGGGLGGRGARRCPAHACASKASCSIRTAGLPARARTHGCGSTRKSPAKPPASLSAASTSCTTTICRP